MSITPVIDGLIKEGKLVADTRADVAYGSLGVGVRPGAPKPDISSVDAFKRTLLNAKSVAYSAEGAGGAYFRGLLERLRNCRRDENDAQTDEGRQLCPCHTKRRRRNHRGCYLKRYGVRR